MFPHSARGGRVSTGRGARPNQTPFLAGEQNDAYLAGEPADDARFVPVFAHALEHTPGIHRKKQSGWLENCCRTFCATTPNVPRPSQTTAAGSSTTFLMSSLLFSPTGR